MAKSAQKLQARALRKQGKSIGEIASLLNASKGAISYWCRDISLSKDQIHPLLITNLQGLKKGQLIVAEMRRNERYDRVGKFQMEAFEDIGKLTERDLFMLGIALYWAEGSKTRGQTILCNTDPNILRAFLHFVQYVHSRYSPEIQCRIQLNISHKERYQQILAYWMSELSLKENQFAKPTFIQVKHKKIYPHPEKYYGVVRIVVRKSTNLNYKINGYINVVKYTVQNDARVAQW